MLKIESLAILFKASEKIPIYLYAFKLFPVTWLNDVCISSSGKHLDMARIRRVHLGGELAACV